MEGRVLGNTRRLGTSLFLPAIRRQGLACSVAWLSRSLGRRIMHDDLPYRELSLLALLLQSSGSVQFNSTIRCSLLYLGHRHYNSLKLAIGLSVSPAPFSPL